MKKKTTAIVSLALAATIAVSVAGCSTKDKKADGEYVSSSSTAQESTVTNANGEIVTGNSASTTAKGTSASVATTAKGKKAKNKNKKETTTKPYYVTNINGKKVTTTLPYVAVTNKKGQTVTKKNGEVVTTQLTTTTTKPAEGETTEVFIEGTTTYTTTKKNNMLPEQSFDDYMFTESSALYFIQMHYPEKWVNYFPDYDPNNNGEYSYYAVFTSPDRHTITSVITVNLVNGDAVEKDLKTGKETTLKLMD
ncbi:hypothetical protein [uncultured Eubacterium sp.]|uniref:hypothetical protein n=1 Tax=uncultured Eubacterium sp. TaxID=165185 RepID=UPI0025E408D3|nr:hypothetical protein [uncultured Eubacterium sp.]